MKKHPLFIILFFKMLIFVSCQAGFNSAVPLVKIKCSYQAYACGDCFPQFKIDNVLSPSGKKELVGRDIHVMAVMEGKEVPLETLIDSCWICYDYILEGNFKKTFFQKNNVFIADKYSTSMKFEGCCD